MDASSQDDRLQRARGWFAKQGRESFEFQEEVWRAYWRGESGLLNAGTGTGKTMAAWLGPVLEHEGDAAGMQVLWITPLRALARDLEKALTAPLKALGSTWRVEQRTGDTSSYRRARQRTKPPQALITTPESLSLLLSYADSRAAVRARAHRDRGRVARVPRQQARCAAGTGIGEVAPVPRAAHDCVYGACRRPCPTCRMRCEVLLGPGEQGRLIRAPQPKRYDIEAMLPPSLERFPWSGHLGLQLLPQVIERIEKARSTLLFTNTRSQAELWYQAIITARTDWLTRIGIHHGSIDAKIRRKVEDGIKEGWLSCVVCTSSLDLGVDFPPVDQVLQIGSPKCCVAIAAACRPQRPPARRDQPHRCRSDSRLGTGGMRRCAARRRSDGTRAAPRSHAGAGRARAASGDAGHRRRFRRRAGAGGSARHARLRRAQRRAVEMGDGFHHPRRRRTAGLPRIPSRGARRRWSLPHRRR